MLYSMCYNANIVAYYTPNLSHQGMPKLSPN